MKGHLFSAVHKISFPYDSVCLLKELSTSGLDIVKIYCSMFADCICTYLKQLVLIALCLIYNLPSLH